MTPEYISHLATINITGFQVCALGHPQLHHIHCCLLQVVAGRSELSNSFQTYMDNFNKAFRTGLSYATAAGSRLASVVFRSKMLGR